MSRCRPLLRSVAILGVAAGFAVSGCSSSSSGHAAASVSAGTSSSPASTSSSSASSSSSAPAVSDAKVRAAIAASESAAENGTNQDQGGLKCGAITAAQVQQVLPSFRGFDEGVETGIGTSNGTKDRLQCAGSGLTVVIVDPQAESDARSSVSSGDPAASADSGNWWVGVWGSGLDQRAADAILGQVIANLS